VEVQEATGCRHVRGFTKDARIVVDQKYKHLLREDFPERFSPYVVAMAAAGQVIPWGSPPNLPDHLRKSKKIKEVQATWVASHLCHDRLCVNPDHLTFEPSWFNRLRDNCPGGDGCVHRPKPCIRAHRPAGELINWEDYWESGLTTGASQEAGSGGNDDEAEA